MKMRIVALLCTVMLALGALSPLAFAAQSQTRYPISVEEYDEGDAHRIKKVYQRQPRRKCSCVLKKQLQTA